LRVSLWRRLRRIELGEGGAEWIEAQSVRKSVVFDRTPDRRSYRGALVVGKIDRRHGPFRVGVHLGDAVEEKDGDLMGDGVNIAARLGSRGGPNVLGLSGAPKTGSVHRPCVDRQMSNSLHPTATYAAATSSDRFTSIPAVRCASPKN
jgi:hypothetical protein